MVRQRPHRIRLEVAMQCVGLALVFGSLALSAEGTTQVRGASRAAVTLTVGNTSVALDAGASAALATQTSKLLHFLVGAPEEPSREWMNHCIDYTHDLCASIDRGNTDLQLLPLLKEQCELEKEFPGVYEDGFKTKDACEDFAERLVLARDRELRNEVVEGKRHYEGFCEHYYAHITGEDRKKTEAKKSGVAASSTLAMAALLATIGSA